MEHANARAASTASNRSKSDKMAGLHQPTIQMLHAWQVLAQQ
jgi:hypothetical protein